MLTACWPDHPDHPIPIAVCTVMMDRGTAPKHVEFYSKNKFEKLMHLVGFVIRIYHDARSSECQILTVTCKVININI